MAKVAFFTKLSFSFPYTGRDRRKNGFIHKSTKSKFCFNSRLPSFPQRMLEIRQ